MAGSVVARPVLSDSKLRHCGDVRPVYSRSCSSEGGHQRLRMRGIGHVQRLRSRDGYQRPTVHGCRPPCVCESAGAVIRRCPIRVWVRLLAVARHEARLPAARRVRTFSAAHVDRGSQRPMDLGLSEVHLCRVAP